jgi:two-component system, LytTR family, sensor kinase
VLGLRPHAPPPPKLFASPSVNKRLGTRDRSTSDASRAYPGNRSLAHSNRLNRPLIPDQVALVRPQPWPLLTTAVAGWALVALVSAGVAFGQSPSQLSIPPDHLLAAELLSLVLWVLLSVPGLALIRSMLRGRSAAARSLLSGLGVGLVCSLAFAVVEQQLLRLLVHPNQIRLATAILPDLEARILAFLAMVAVVRGRPLLAVGDPGPSIGRRSRSQPHRKVQPLITQLQSHFLFNTLNDAAELVHVDPDAADELITRLSEFVRAALPHTERGMASLGEELSFMQAYAEIQAVRLRDRLTVRWEVAPQTLDAAMPIFVWQPILENAFRYGATPETGGLTIEIGTRLEETDLVLWIRDEGPGLGDRRVASGGGIGLQNTRERLARLYGASGSIEVRTVEGGVLAVLRLPFSVQRDASAQVPR